MDPEPKQRPAEGLPLSPQASRSSKWRRLVLTMHGIPLLALLVAAGWLTKFLLSQEENPRCPVGSSEVSARIVLICEEEYLRERSPRVGAFLADQLRQLMRFDSAKGVARELLDTVARADALTVLGKIANRESELEKSKDLLKEAAELHANKSEWRKAARDLMWVGYSMDELREHAQASEARERAFHFAELAHDNDTIRDLHLAASLALLDLGNGSGALAELRLAYPEGTEPRPIDLLSEANLMQSAGKHLLAIQLFSRALSTGKLSQVLTFNAHINLALSLTETGDLDSADKHLMAAKALDTENNWPASTAAVEGLLAWRQGRLEPADQLFARAIDNVKDAEIDDKAEYLTDRAELAVEREDWKNASAYAQQAVDMVDAVRDKQQPLLYRSWITERYRRGYELLFLTLAHANLAENALLALDRWQAQGTLDTLTPSGAGSPAAPQSSSTGIQTLIDVKRALQSTALATRPDRSTLLGRMANKDLLAIVIVQLPRRAPGKSTVKDEVWRLWSHSGRLHLDLLGQYSQLAHRFDKFMSDPLGSPDEAAALGALLIPPELAVPTDRVLHVLLDSKLQALPVAALRIGAQPLVALRPPLRILRPSEVECAPPLGAAPTMNVLADAAGDLPGAYGEAASIASRFKVPSLTRAQATLAALRQRADVKHLGVHSSASSNGGEPDRLNGIEPERGFAPNDGVLHLHDGDEHAVDIATRGNAPALVVLSSCVSAISEAGTYSLAIAYLIGGANQVIATLRKIEDKGSAHLAEKFYSQGGLNDAVRALAKVQAELAKTDDRQWPQFAIYGRETCKSGKSPTK